MSRGAVQAIKVLNMIKVYGKPIRVNKASQDKRSQDVGANLFIGNLDPEVDEKVRSAFPRSTECAPCVLSRLITLISPCHAFLSRLIEMETDQQRRPCVMRLQLLYDTFSAFGVIAQTPKIMRDPDTGVSRGFGFVSYDSFEASDAAIEAMNGQFLCNR